MADEPTTVDPGTETPAPEAAEQAATGSEQKAGEGVEKVSITAHEYGILRDARAREKALADEVERLKRDTESRTTTTTDTRDDEFSMTEAERKAYKAELKAAAKAGNRDAAALLVANEEAERARAEMARIRFDLEMREIPEDKRDAVKKHMQETGAPTPGIAYRLMLGTEAPTLAQRVKQLEAELAEAKKGRPRVEGTRIQGLPGGDSMDDGVPTKSLAEYNEMMRKDPQKTIAERRAGKFRLKDS